MPGVSKVQIKDIENLCFKALTMAGVEEQEAQYLVDSALDKDLQDDHLRGVNSIPGLVGAFRSGQVSPKTTLEVLKESDAYATVNGTGHPRLVCAQGMRLAINKARRSGIAMVTVKQGAGTLAPLMKMAVEEDMIGFSSTEGPASIAPTGGTTPLLGNNPIGFGIPAGKEHPLILDMSISLSSASPVQAAAREGRQVAQGLLLNSDGNPTTDPKVYVGGKPSGPSGSLAPIGGYKGYALAMVMGILTTSLIGVHSRREAREGEPAGTFLMAIDVGQFVPLPQFRSEVDALITTVQNSSRKSGVDRIFYPGERSQELQHQRRQTGVIELPEGVLQNLEKLASQMEIPFRL